MAARTIPTRLTPWRPALPFTPSCSKPSARRKGKSNRPRTSYTDCVHGSARIEQRKKVKKAAIQGEPRCPPLPFSFSFSDPWKSVHAVRDEVRGLFPSLSLQESSPRSRGGGE